MDLPQYTVEKDNNGQYIVNQGDGELSKFMKAEVDETVESVFPVVGLTSTHFIAEGNGMRINVPRKLIDEYVEEVSSLRLTLGNTGDGLFCVDAEVVSNR